MLYRNQWFAQRCHDRLGAQQGDHCVEDGCGRNAEFQLDPFEGVFWNRRLTPTQSECAPPRYDPRIDRVRGRYDGSGAVRANPET